MYKADRSFTASNGTYYRDDTEISDSEYRGLSYSDQSNFTEKKSSSSSYGTPYTSPSITTDYSSYSSSSDNNSNSSNNDNSSSFDFGGGSGGGAGSGGDW